MALRKKKNESTCDTVAVPQTGGNSHPFMSLSSYNPTSPDMELYRSLREAIPVIDAALYKLIRLLGNFEIICSDKEAEKELRDFLQSVNVGGTRQGINAFISSYFEQLLTYGTAVGEICTDGRSITHLFNADLRTISLSYGENPLDVIVSSESSGTFTPVKYPSLVLLSVHNPEPGKLYGNSILKGLPFKIELP